MKKLFLFVLTFCLGQTSTVMAADTDISGIANVIYIEPFEASPGTTDLDLTVKMKNTAAIRGFQFDLVLPAGVTPAIEDSEYIYWLNGDRAPKKAGGQLYHTIDVSVQTDGSYRFLVGSTADKTFTGNEGEIAFFRVNIASNMAAGNHAIQLKDVKLTETAIENHYDTDLVESTLTITDNPRTLLSETSIATPVAANNVNVKVRRTIKADEWSTICLPFAMTAAQVQTAFGNDVQLADFTSWSSEKDGTDVTGITIGFTDAAEIAANHPYIIKVSSPVTEFTVDGVNIVPAVTPSKQVGTTDADRGYMYGTFGVKKIPEQGLFLSDNKFWYSTGTVTTKAYRGYFALADVLSAYSASSNSIKFIFNDEQTGVQTVTTATRQTEQLYNLQGQPVAQPTKGLYIRNGKKYITK